MVIKLGQFTKLGPFSTFQLFKSSKLCYYFLSRFGNENNLFIPRPSLFGIHWPKNVTKKIGVSVNLKKKNAKIKCREGSRKNLSKLHAIHLRTYLSCSIFKGWLAPWITNMCLDRLDFHENFLPQWLHYAGKQGIVPSGRWSCALGGTRRFTMLGLCASLLYGCLTSS